MNHKAPRPRKPGGEDPVKDDIEFEKIPGLVMDTKNKTVFRRGDHYETYETERLSENAWNVLLRMADKDCKLSRQEFDNQLSPDGGTRKETARELRDKLSCFHVACDGKRNPGVYELIDQAPKNTGH